MTKFIKSALAASILTFATASVNAAGSLGDVTENSPNVYNLTAGGVSDYTIESTLGIALGSLDSLSSTNVKSGSIVYDTININTGDLFSFDWDWTNAEVDNGFDPSIYGDFAFATFSLDGGLYKFVDTFAPTGTTGTFSWTSTGTGPLTWAVGVVNTGDQYVHSEITLSNISGVGAGLITTPISAVPEPSTYALMLGGLGLVSFMAALRRKQA